jgi:dual specificity tyrosine-phosphorylation-regulated kinase 2/3/4
VFRVLDHKRKAPAALKIIKNKKRFHNQALVEISILKEIREHEGGNLVKMKDYIMFRDHVVISFKSVSCISASYLSY